MFSFVGAYLLSFCCASHIFLLSGLSDNHSFKRRSNHNILRSFSQATNYIFKHAVFVFVLLCHILFGILLCAILTDNQLQLNFLSENMRTIICILALVALACGQCGDPSENTACPAGTLTHKTNKTRKFKLTVEIITKECLPVAR